MHVNLPALKSARRSMVGFIFLPWTTLAYLYVFPNGIVGFEWIVLAVAIFDRLVRVQRQLPPPQPDLFAGGRQYNSGCLRPLTVIGRRFGFDLLDHYSL